MPQRRAGGWQLSWPPAPTWGPDPTARTRFALILSCDAAVVVIDDDRH
jgi:hypothetical protein